jgi:hypothetical protein
VAILREATYNLLQVVERNADDIQILRDIILREHQQAEADRAVMREIHQDLREIQAEIQGIWQYLLGQQGNGDGKNGEA